MHLTYWEQWQVEARLVSITGDMTADKAYNGSDPVLADLTERRRLSEVDRNLIPELPKFNSNTRLSTAGLAGRRTVPAPQT